MVVESDFNTILKKCKIQIKNIGFSFTLNKIDETDIQRMEFVYDVLVACNGDKTLTSLSLKIKPKFETISKKYPKKINRQQWESLDIHNKKDVIDIINLCKSVI